MLVSPVKSSRPGGTSAISGRQNESHADFHDARGLDDVDLVDRPWGTIVNAGSDLICHCPEPAHHRALIRPDDVEARGQVRREQDQQGDRKQGTAAALERPGNALRPWLAPARGAFADAIAGQPRASSELFPGFLFQKPIGIGGREPLRSCGGPAAPTGAAAPGDGSPGAGCCVETQHPQDFSIRGKKQQSFCRRGSCRKPAECGGIRRTLRSCPNAAA